jgi:hypothetical protein
MRECGAEDSLLVNAFGHIRLTRVLAHTADPFSILLVSLMTFKVDFRCRMPAFDSWGQSGYAVCFV